MTIKSLQITEFYDTEYLNSALYQSFRTIGNYIDGLKPGARKAVYTADKFNIKDRIKLCNFCARVIETTNYLHGPTSLEGSIVNMAQCYVGSNTINMFFPDGNFGTRFTPEAAASRYIYTHKSEHFDKIFRKEDREILIKQSFENEQIEYRFYAPVIPLILVNGSYGIGNGFGQNILPRSKQQIVNQLKKYLDARLQNKTYKFQDLNPYYKGFTGDIKLDKETGAWKIYGKFEKINSANIKITELPIGYDLQGYLKVLNTLVDKKVIKDYHDKSEDDKFTFTLNVTREFSDQSDEGIFESLRLIKRETENFTCIDEFNKIVEFKDENELFATYIKIRLEYYQKRKDYLVQHTKNQLDILHSKWLFIKGVIDETIKVNNKQKEVVVKQLEKVEKIIKIDNSYDYLLNIPIYNLTKEKVDELKEKIDKMKEELKRLIATKIEEIWIQDLNEV